MTGPTNLFTFQDVPGVPVWCRETWTRTLIYTGLGRNPYRLPVIVNALDTWWGLNILSKFELPSSYGLGFMIL